MLLAVLIFLSVTQATDDEHIIMTLKYSRRRVKPVVVQGEPVPHGALPYVVSIKVPLTRQGKVAKYTNLCGGSIISATKVLTAAHCFSKNHFYYQKHSSLIRIVAGDVRNVVPHSADVSTTGKTQWRKIDSLKLHPLFHFPRNDIALVLVKPSWSFSRSVCEVAIARSRIDYVGPCYSAGYGNVGHKASDRSSPVLLRAKTEVMTRDQCKTIWEVDMDNFVCSYSYVSDVGLGDSGGPLVCRRTADPAERTGRDLLVGVVSGKNYDKTTLYTRVAAYSDFIGPVDGAQSGVAFAANVTMVLGLVFLFTCY